MSGSRLETVGSVFTRCVFPVGRGQASQRVTTLLAWPEGTRLRVSEPGEALVLSLLARNWCVLSVPPWISELSDCVRRPTVVETSRIKKRLKNLTGQSCVFTMERWMGWGRDPWLEAVCGGSRAQTQPVGGEAIATRPMPAWHRNEVQASQATG